MTVVVLGLGFMVGTFTVWKVGRTRYYDEERLVDLSVFSTAVGLAVWWLVGVMGERWGTSFEMGKFLVGNWRVLFSVSLSFVFSIYYIKRLRWSLWPTLGFLWLGTSVGNGVIAVLSFALPQLLVTNYYLLISILTFLLAYYIVVAGGDAWLIKQKNNLRRKLSSWRSV